MFSEKRIRAGKRLKQYQDKILDLLYLTFSQLSIAHYKKQEISVNDLKYNKYIFKRKIWHFVGYKGLHLQFKCNFLVKGPQSDVVLSEGLKILTFFKWRRIILSAHVEPF